MVENGVVAGFRVTLPTLAFCSGPGAIDIR